MPQFRFFEHFTLELPATLSYCYSRERSLRRIAIAPSGEDARRPALDGDDEH